MVSIWRRQHFGNLCCTLLTAWERLGDTWLPLGLLERKDECLAAQGTKKWESQLLSNLEKLNIVLMGFLSHFLSVKNALISGLCSKTE